MTLLPCRFDGNYQKKTYRCRYRSLLTVIKHPEEMPAGSARHTLFAGPASIRTLTVPRIVPGDYH
jgi:hypothetical protein